MTDAFAFVVIRIPYRIISAAVASSCEFTQCHRIPNHVSVSIIGIRGVYVYIEIYSVVSVQIIRDIVRNIIMLKDVHSLT